MRGAGFVCPRFALLVFAFGLKCHLSEVPKVPKGLFNDKAKACPACCLMFLDLEFLGLNLCKLAGFVLGNPVALEVAKCHGMPLLDLGAMISGNFSDSLNKRSGAVGASFSYCGLLIRYKPSDKGERVGCGGFGQSLPASCFAMLQGVQD